MSHSEIYRGFELKCTSSRGAENRTWVGLVQYRPHGAGLFREMLLTTPAASARIARLRIRALARDQMDKLADRLLKNIECNAVCPPPAPQPKSAARVTALEHSNGLFQATITFATRTVLATDCDLMLLAFFRTARAAQIEATVWAAELISAGANDGQDPEPRNPAMAGD